jgi:hypothetical protein
MILINCVLPQVLQIRATHGRDGPPTEKYCGPLCRGKFTNPSARVHPFVWQRGHIPRPPSRGVTFSLIARRIRSRTSWVNPCGGGGGGCIRSNRPKSKISSLSQHISPQYPCQVYNHGTINRSSCAWSVGQPPFSSPAISNRKRRAG